VTGVQTCALPILHYEIRLGGRPVNPLTYILDSYAIRRWKKTPVWSTKYP